jgi:6-phosphofructokinase 1
MSQDREDGVAVLAEGIAEVMDPADFSALGSVSRDEHGHVELAELDVGRVLKEAVLKCLKPYCLVPTIRVKDLGFELRCADPIPFDMEYCRDLGCHAAEYLLSGGTGMMVSIVNGKFSPIPFDAIVDPATQRTTVRMVDVTAEHYRIARRYMTRLEKTDFDHSDRLARCARILGLSPDTFRQRFSGVL